MPTLAEKVVGVATMAVLDVAVFALGGPVLLWAAVLATGPFTVVYLHR